MFERLNPSAEYAEVTRLRELIDPICRKFLAGEILLHDAEREIREHLKTRNVRELPSEATFSSKEYDVVNNSLNAARDYI